MAIKTAKDLNIVDQLVSDLVLLAHNKGYGIRFTETHGKTAYKTTSRVFIYDNTLTVRNCTSANVHKLWLFHAGLNEGSTRVCQRYLKYKVVKAYLEALEPINQPLKLKEEFIHLDTDSAYISMLPFEVTCNTFAGNNLAQSFVQSGYYPPARVSRVVDWSLLPRDSKDLVYAMNYSLKTAMAVLQEDLNFNTSAV